MLAVERDVKPRNMNFAKVDRRKGVLILALVSMSILNQKKSTLEHINQAHTYIRSLSSSGCQVTTPSSVFIH